MNATASNPNAVELTFLTRKDCHLCSSALAVVHDCLSRTPHTVDMRIIDIDSDPTLQAQYDWDVPVVLLAGRQHSFHRVDATRLLAALDRLAAREHDSQPTGN